MRHFQVRGILNRDWILCGAKGEEATVDRSAVDCYRCRRAMDTDKTDRAVMLEGLHFMAERGYPEAATLIWELYERMLEDDDG